jgi:RHS repeat-associated protein
VAKGGNIYIRIKGSAITNQEQSRRNNQGVRILEISRYFHTDHLGSVDTITNETGAVVQRLSYDAFGKRRNANGTDAATITAQTTRGFTRHEHDDEVGLVNMNAREYDPLLGRFATPDTIVQFAHHSQSYNRYSYVHNNPLSFTDPTGRGLGKWLKKTVKKYGKTIVAAVAAYYGYTGISDWLTAGTGTAGFTAQSKLMLDANTILVENTLNWAGSAVAGGAAGGVFGGISDGTLRGAAQGTAYGGIGAATGLANPFGGLHQSIASNGPFWGTAMFAGNQALNGAIRNEIGEYAARHGYSLGDFNLRLFGLSLLGNITPGIGSRFKDSGWANTDWGIRGFNSRGIAGIPFDVVDTALAYQGLPTASSVHYMFSAARGQPLTSHSLGALDVSNLTSLGLAPRSSVYALPFGRMASGVGVTIGDGDLITGFSLGRALNWNADIQSVPFIIGHPCSYYVGCGT